MGDQTFQNFRPDGNGLIFHHLAWLPTLIHRRPPNRGLSPNWRKDVIRSGRNSVDRYHDPNWEITLQ